VNVVVSAKRIVKFTLGSRRRGETDWARVRALTDEEIEAGVKLDPDSAPLLDREWFKNAKLVMPERKQPVTLRLDKDVLEWFKAQGSRYQSRMNAVLRSYMQAHRKAG
jgi:uncharacterized protein (DUF4415 family)